MRYKTLLFDVDDTLLDFQAAEKQALHALFQTEGLTLTSELEQTYKKINQERWQAFEQGQMSREEVVNGRFGAFFARYGRQVDSLSFERKYREFLNEGHQLLGNSRQVIAELAKQADLYVVTNGVSKTQMKRLNDAKLLPYFKEVIVSEATGYQKPMREFFDYTFKKIPNLKKSQTVIIGDSLTSDIQGGVNAGIDTIWFNPKALPTPVTIQPTYRIQQLEELYEILS
ncbi:YjjG family noncanonical pyrimidine nucleotidase [Enterococcus lemanii]|jgi:2-haloacid dehalogenase|uniref:YjjG family noncanonical pyrimidine nucleotidase n=1 Tax=Enterococcus lemanii TaxID=1159752 RepID=A0ABV9MU62_9ENTE|nr:YjjG family noncanonical pyrimidine nucleotidase [Enterococcus lemanii]MBM7709450.1 2-haloacid dehalogenase [Enterococcus lemanii]